MESEVKYGQEIGPILTKIAKKLLMNQNLCKLLINTDKDPLNPETHPNEKINGLDLLHTNVKVVPYVDSDSQDTTSKLVLYFKDGTINITNSDNENLSLYINIFCPYKKWLITGDNLRPFAILYEIRKSLQDVRINGLGEMKYKGFYLTTLTEDMSCYTVEFMVNAFS